jgi:hypothetical protein
MQRGRAGAPTPPDPRRGGRNGGASGPRGNGVRQARLVGASSRRWRGAIEESSAGGGIIDVLASCVEGGDGGG